MTNILFNILSVNIRVWRELLKVFNMCERCAPAGYISFYPNVLRFLQMLTTY